jgi:hypothetical protein
LYSIAYNVISCSRYKTMIYTTCIITIIVSHKIWLMMGKLCVYRMFLVDSKVLAFNYIEQYLTVVSSCESLRRTNVLGEVSLVFSLFLLIRNHYRQNWISIIRYDTLVRFSRFNFEASTSFTNHTQTLCLVECVGNV